MDDQEETEADEIRRIRQQQFTKEARLPEYFHGMHKLLDDTGIQSADEHGRL